MPGEQKELQTKKATVRGARQPRTPNHACTWGWLSPSWVHVPEEAGVDRDTRRARDGTERGQGPHTFARFSEGSACSLTIRDLDFARTLRVPLTLLHLLSSASRRQPPGARQGSKQATRPAGTGECAARIKADQTCRDPAEAGQARPALHVPVSLHHGSAAPKGHTPRALGATASGDTKLALGIFPLGDSH